MGQRPKCQYESCTAFVGNHRIGIDFLDQIEKNIKVRHLVVRTSAHEKKYIIKKRNSQDVDWNKIFAKSIFDKEMVPRIYKEL